MKIELAVFGGTFDPVHEGHIFAIHYVLKNTSIKKVLMVPAGSPPFKNSTYQYSASERLEGCRTMLEQYLSAHPEFKESVLIDDYEIKNSREISYTSNTIKYVKEKYSPEGRVGFIAGDDILPSLNKWHDTEYLKKNIHLIILRRMSEKFDIAPLEKEGWVIDYLDNNIVNFSSTAIKEKISK